MSEDAAAQLASYRLQWQQVETALLTEPNNEELKALKKDLEEVIELTKELVQPVTSSASNGAASSLPMPAWQVGDKCMAWSTKDGKYYHAKIDSISGETVAVTYKNRNATDVVDIHALKPWEEEKKPKMQHVKIDPAPGIWTKPQNKQQQRKLDWQAEKERRRKKLQKRIAKQKEIEAEKEKDKNKWKHWSAKASGKKLKGVQKKMLQKETRETVGATSAPRQVYNPSEYERP